MTKNLNYFIPLTKEDRDYSVTRVIEDLNRGINPCENNIHLELQTLYDCGARCKRPIGIREGFDGRKNQDEEIFFEAKSIQMENKNISLKLKISDITIERYRKYNSYLIVNVYERDNPSHCLYFVGNIRNKMLSKLEFIYKIFKFKSNKENRHSFSIDNLIEMGFNVIRGGTISNQKTIDFLKSNLDEKNWNKVSKWSSFPHCSEVDWDRYYDMTA